MKWKVSNNERPTKEGFYYTVDSIGCKSVTEFARNHWYSSTGHPVVEWLDESPSTETGQPTYTLDQIRQAGKEGEVNHLDVEHIIDLLKEGSDKSTEKGQQGVEEQAEWEFLTIIRANRAILKNADGKVAFPNHSAKSAALEVYDDMIEIISHLPAKRSGKEKQVADYVNNLPQPQVGQDELWEKAAMELFLAHNPDSSPENEVNKRIINGFRKDMKILSLFFTIIKK